MEDKAQFLGLLNEYISTYRPQHRDELDLLTEAVFAKWRQQRLWLAETNQIEVAIAQNENDLRRALPTATTAAQLANGIAKSEQILKLYLRYDAQLHRHYRNCLKDLNDLQDRRAAQPPVENPVESPEPTEPKPPATEPACPPPTEPKSPPEQAKALADRAEILRHMNQSLGRTPTA